MPLMTARRPVICTIRRNDRSETDISRRQWFYNSAASSLQAYLAVLKIGIIWPKCQADFGWSDDILGLGISARIEGK